MQISGRSIGTHLKPLACRVLAAAEKPRAWLGIYALLALLAFPILEISLLGQSAPQYAHDVFDEGTATRLGAIAADWHQYGITLWNPHLTGGNALLSQFALSPFSVDVLLSLVLSPFVAYAIMYWLYVWVAGFAMHGFLSESVRLPPPACLAGGIVYMFGFWHYCNGIAVPALPLLLWLSDRILLSPGKRWLYTGSLVGLIGFLLYNSQVQLVAVLGAVQGVYIVFRARFRTGLWSQLGEWALAWGLGLLLYAPVLATLLVFLPQSQRMIWTLAYLSADLPAALLGLGRLYPATFLGIPSPSGSGGLPGNYGTYFMGLIGLSLLSISLLAPRRSRKEWFLLAGLVAIPAFDLLASTVASPLQANLGFLKSFQLVRVRHFLPFFLAANVGIGLARLQDMRWSQVTAGRLRKAVWLALLLNFLVQATIAARRVRALDWSVAASDLQSMLGRFGWVLALVYMIASVGIWVLWLMRGKRILDTNLRHSLPFLLLTLLLADRVVYARIERWVSPGALDTFEHALGTTPALAFLSGQANEEAYRSISIGSHANVMMFHRLYAADGYENVYPLRYHELFGLLTDPYLVKNPGRYQYFHSWGNRAYAFGTDLDLPLADLMGIRWIFAYQVPVSNSRLAGVLSDNAWQVYENLDVLPRSFVVHRVRAFADRAELLDGLGKASAMDLRTQAYGLQEELSGLAPPESSADANSRATISRYEPDKVYIDVDTSLAGILVLTDVNAPGWVCEVNAKKAQILPVYNAFRGVQVPAGHSQVVFRYVPTYTYAGAGLAVLAVQITSAWCRILKRKRAHAP